jgi:hypothetical protein
MQFSNSLTVFERMAHFTLASSVKPPTSEPRQLSDQRSPTFFATSLKLSSVCLRFSAESFSGSAAS